VLKQIFVLNILGYRQVFINPEIKTRRGKLRYAPEKCFSEPGVSAVVPRFDLITAKHKDGHIKLSGLAARVFQHEADHLQGRLISRFKMEK
jgi:peptide deformylase